MQVSNPGYVVYTIYDSTNIIMSIQHVITPRAHARARGYVIGRGVYIYIIYYYKSALFFGTNLLSPKILTFRGLFQHR